jgi:integral membrane protein
MKKLYSRFRKVAFAEGVSFLVLLAIAMPLKYFANIPMAVTITGGLHGILFIAFIVLAYQIQSANNKPFSWVVKAGLASILPFGTFYMDREWKKEEASLSVK